jgi:hypothetical protein
MLVKFFSALILSALVAYAAYLYADVVPWWGIAPACFLVAAAVPQKPWRSWLSAFVGVLACWWWLTSQMDAANGQLLSKKIAELLPLGGSSLALGAVAAAVGGLTAAFSALSATYLRKAPPKKL